MAKSKLVEVNSKIADAVVGGYKKIENGVVGSYEKIENAFVDRYLTKDGETIDEAKARIKDEQEARKIAQAERLAMQMSDTEKRVAEARAKAGLN